MHWLLSHRTTCSRKKSFVSAPPCSSLGSRLNLTKWMDTRRLQLRKLKFHTTIQRSMLCSKHFLTGSRMLPREDGRRSLLLVAPRSLPRIFAPPMPYQLCLHQDWHVVEPQVLLCKRFCKFSMCVLYCFVLFFVSPDAFFCIPKGFFCSRFNFLHPQMLFCIPKRFFAAILICSIPR